jgi:hypothetical protein
MLRTLRRQVDADGGGIIHSPKKNNVSGGNIQHVTQNCCSIKIFPHCQGIYHFLVMKINERTQFCTVLLQMSTKQTAAVAKHVATVEPLITDTAGEFKFCPL